MKRILPFFSRLGKLFKRPPKEEATIAAEPAGSAPPAPEKTKRPSRPTPTPPPPPHPPSPQPPPTPQPSDAGPPGKKRPQKRKLDKKGFRVLTDKDDLYGIFEAENDFTRQSEQHESFDRLFEKSRTDIYQQRLLREKIHEEYKKNHTRPLTTGERLKVYPPPQAELDLHGCTAPEAGTKTETFIRNARRRGIRTVRVIVGKGIHSNGKAILPDLIETRIIQLKRRQWVLSFKWEKKDKRKSGALIVYLS